MPISRRYTPEHPPGESCNFGLDYSFVIPPGVGISRGTLVIYENTFDHPVASPDWSVGEVQVFGRTLYAFLSGGIDGRDYQLVWTAYDNLGNVWPRTVLVLCAATS